MGINNLCRLLDACCPPSAEPDAFDSLLIDCQSFLYVAIDFSLETEEEKLFREICESTWGQLSSLLNTFEAFPCGSESPTVVLSFDGEGVPMKWATQRERRSKGGQTSQKSFYRYVLFGNNTLTLRVQRYLLEKLRLYNRTLTIVLAGCNVPGEGEHKIFQLAESLPGCRRPVVVSVDQDVFVLGFLRLRHYDTLQIYRYGRFYHLTRLAPLLRYPLRRFLDVSTLFGNDFVPALVGITPANLSRIHSALEEGEGEDPPGVLAAFLRGMRGRLRFETAERVDRLLVVCFWMTHLWILDYYTRRRFPQQFLENRVYEAFDRGQLLTALADEGLSRSAYLEARETYGDMVTQPIPHAERHIFTDPDLLEGLRSYWVAPKHGRCRVLRLTSSRSSRGGGGRGSPPTGGETPR